VLARIEGNLIDVVDPFPTARDAKRVGLLPRCTRAGGNLATSQNRTSAPHRRGTLSSSRGASSWIALTDLVY
jgi:hypothetical protein